MSLRNKIIVFTYALAWEIFITAIPLHFNVLKIALFVNNVLSASGE